MAIDTNNLIKKINFTRASKLLKDRGFVEEHFVFPTNLEEEEDAVRRMVYHFLKKRFVGCKLRSNSLTFSLRLDGEIHKKVYRVKTKVLQDAEWKKWFQDNHRDMFREIERHGNVFHGESVDFREKEGNNFLYVPVQMNRINAYQNHGVMAMIQFLDKAYDQETLVAGMYDRVVDLMEGEVRRKEDEIRRRIENDATTYHDAIQRALLNPIADVKANPTTFEDKLAARMYEWCNEKGITPAYAFEPTYERVVPLGINVDVLVRNEDTDEDWYAVPTFGGYETPEGFTLLDGYGDVTAHDPNGRRTREGIAPIVILKHMYVQYNMDFWKPHFPEGYFEILEATRRFSEEVQVEVERVEEERKVLARRQKEEEEQRQREEMQARLERQLADKKVKEIRDAEAAEQQQALMQEEEARRNILRDQLVAQLTQAQDAMQAAEPTPTAFPNGIYRNTRAIPLERYVTVTDGNVRRFATRTAAIDLLRGLGWTWANLAEVNVRNYDNIAEVVETIEV